MADTAYLTLEVQLNSYTVNTEFFLVRMRENTDQKKLVFGHFSHSDIY